MKKIEIIIILILLTFVIGLGVYYLLKNKKKTSSEEKESTKPEEACDSNRKNLELNDEADNIPNRNNILEDSDNCQLDDSVPFETDSNISIEPSQSRTTDEYIEWQNNRKPD